MAHRSSKGLAAPAVTVRELKTPLDWALAYARIGWPVFMVGADKKPISCAALDLWHGVDDATLDAGLIRTWWETFPEAGIGMSCRGAALDVLDTDRKIDDQGKVLVDAEAAFLEICAGRPDGALLRARTPCGGKHRFYLADPARPLVGRIALLPGLDWRTAHSNNYVVVPDGREGRFWIDDEPWELLP